MIQALDIGPMSFEKFLQWIPEDGRQYELYSGVAVQMQPTGPHELVSAFIAEELILFFDSISCPTSFPKVVSLHLNCLIQGIVQMWWRSIRQP